MALVEELLMNAVRRGERGAWGNTVRAVKNNIAVFRAVNGKCPHHVAVKET